MPVPHPVPDGAATLRAGRSGPGCLARCPRSPGGLPLRVYPGARARGRYRGGRGCGAPTMTAAMTPVLVASERGEVGLAAGMALLRAGASAMDAVEAAIRVVESNEEDHYAGVAGEACVRVVEHNEEDRSGGVGGLPTLRGVGNLAPSVMDGGPGRAGAV